MRQLLIFLLLLPAFAFGQNYKNIISVANNTTAFGVNVSKGTKVYDAGADLYYYCITSTAAASTLTSASANFIRQANYTELDSSLWALNGTVAYLKAGLTKVGIGTTAPSAKLNVVQTNAAEGFKLIQNGEGTAFIIDQNANRAAFDIRGGGGGYPIGSFRRDVGANGLIQINTSGTNPQILFDTEDGVSKWSVGALDSNNDQFAIGQGDNLGTTSHVPFVIEENGNVGIGTTAPDEKLHVAGNIEIDENYAIIQNDTNLIRRVGTDWYLGEYSYSNVCIGTTTPVEALTVNGDVYGNTAKFTHYGGHSDFTFGDDGNIVEVLADTMVHENVKVLGRLGINSKRAAPYYQLDVNGNVNIDGGMITMDAGQAIGFGTAGADFIMKCESSPKDLTFSVATSEKMRIETGGNVGIGTTNPSSKLHVVGSQYTSADIGLGGDVKIAADKGIYFATTDAAVKHEDSSDDLLIQTSSTTRIRIEDEGNVGIGLGTVAPACNLQVKGAIVSGTLTLEAGTHDATNVSAVNVIYVNTVDGSVTIGGFTDGVAGQILHIVVVDATYNTTLENDEGTTQEIFLNGGTDHTLTATYGGWILVCDGSNWYECGN